MLYLKLYRNILIYKGQNNKLLKVIKIPTFSHAKPSDH